MENKMAKSARTTGNDKVADPGGTRPKPAATDKVEQKTRSGDRNDEPAKHETRIKK
jgi:hypothetical protein